MAPTAVPGDGISGLTLDLALSAPKGKERAHHGLTVQVCDGHY